MKKLWLVWAGAVFILAFTFILHAQSTAPDSIVQLAAQTQGLSLVSPSDLPESGTFWLMTSNGVTVPDPAPLFDSSLPVYQIADDEYLVDATEGQVVIDTETQQTVADALAGLSNDVVDLINQVQDAQASQETAMSSRMSGSRMVGGMMAMDDDDGGDFTPAFSFDTNSLYLQIIGVTNGTAYLTLNNATDEVYEVMSKVDLSATNWTIEQEVWPTNSSAMPFTVPEQGRANLFVWAMDWTGIASNGNTTPDWWFWEYFGTVNLSDTNLDSVGNTLLYDYQNGFDPNIISFSIQVTNNYVNSMSVPVQLNMAAGVPYYFTVLVDDTNYVADANWQSYAGTNINVNLGLTEGWHDVWIGLKGLPSNAMQTWRYKHLKLDYTPPLLVVTNPVVSTVSVPMIQLQGYSPEALSGISYDLTNALGLVTNQDAGISDQYYDTNTWEFTTNYFECVDVPLTNGLNVITLHATDMAGNTTTTNISITLDYSSRTNPPVVQLYWPQDGTLVCNSNYTWRGWVDDPTATVTAQMVDTNGNTNIFSGIVERDGDFWVENLPMTGTNFLLLTVTDSAGNVAVTNITVYPGAVALAIAMPDSSQLWNQGVTVNGTTSDSADYTVWVNGVKASYTDGTDWTATNVYLPTGGTALIQARAIPNSDNGGNGTGGSGGGPVTYDNIGNPDPPSDNDAESQTDRPMRLYVKTYKENTDVQNSLHYSDYDSYGDWLDSGTGQDKSHEDQNWTDGSGGNGSQSYQDSVTSSDPSGSTNSSLAWTSQQTWPASWWPDLADGTQTASGDYDWPVFDADIDPPDVEWEHCAISFPYAEDYTFDVGGYSGTYARKADVVLKLQTGGKATSVRQNLWQLSASATQWSPTNAGGSEPDIEFTAQAVPPQNITIDGKAVGGDGNLWRTYADNDTRTVTPQVSGADYYTFNVGAQKYTLTLTANTTNLDNATPEFCVGQQVNFALNGLPNSVVNMVGNWNLPDTFVNESYPDSSTCTSYDINNSFLQNTANTSCWFINKPGGKVSVGMDLLFPNGQHTAIAADGSISVYRPTVSFTPEPPFTVMVTNGLLELGDSGTGVMRFEATVQSKYSGVVNWTQLINRYGEYGPLPFWYTTTHGDYWLDTSQFYGDDNGRDKGVGPTESDPTIHFNDNPGIQSRLLYADISDSFQTYLVFNPGGGIWVTLGIVDWGWSGNALYFTSGWELDGSSVTSPTYTDSDIFPTWPEIYTGTLQNN